MKALVLDFDGVISDSVGEVFIVARRTYLELCPDSELRVRDTDELNRAFRQLMPLGNRAEDYGTALLALERRRPVGELAFEHFNRPGQVGVQGG